MKKSFRLLRSLKKKEKKEKEKQIVMIKRREKNLRFLFFFWKEYVSTFPIPNFSSLFILAKLFFENDSLKIQ
jgi:hypothetical protein